MNREIAQTVYRFFLNEMVIGLGSVDLFNMTVADFDKNKAVLLKGLEVGDSDIVDIQLATNGNGQNKLLSYHRENPALAFDFMKEESEGTKRLTTILILLLRKMMDGATFFIDEFDLKLHLRLAEFVLDLIRASKKAQMVFTSHNPWLIDKESLRPEQIVFVNKQTDGNSEFVPLSDFIGSEKISDPRKAYLQGRFDAVPYVGDAHRVLSEMLRNDEKA